MMQEIHDWILDYYYFKLKKKQVQVDEKWLGKMAGDLLLCVCFPDLNHTLTMLFVP